MESRGFGNPRATFDTYTKGTRGLDDFRWLVLWPLDVSPKPLLYLNPLPLTPTACVCCLVAALNGAEWVAVRRNTPAHLVLKGSCYWRGCQFMAWLDIFACVYIWFCRLNREKNEAVSSEILTPKFFHLETGSVFFFDKRLNASTWEMQCCATSFFFFGTFPIKVMQTFIQQPYGFTSWLSNNHNYCFFFLLAGSESHWERLTERGAR